MNLNILELIIKSTEYNGWPTLNIYLGEQLVNNIQVASESTSVKISIPQTACNTFIRVERYGKTNDNFLLVDDKIIKDQTIEIVSMLIDNVQIPEWMIFNNCKIEYNNTTYTGSKFLGPNGVWEFSFETPILTYLLDQKIIHEAKYNNNYKYPWSYQFGPDSVSTLAKELAIIKELIHKKL